MDGIGRSEVGQAADGFAEGLRSGVLEENEEHRSGVGEGVEAKGSTGSRGEGERAGWGPQGRNRALLRHCCEGQEKGKGQETHVIRIADMDTLTVEEDRHSHNRRHFLG